MSDRSFFPIGDTMYAELTEETQRWPLQIEVSMTLLVTCDEENNGPVFIKFGDEEVEAQPDVCTPVLRGSAQTFGIDSQTTHVAACMRPGATGIIWITPGQGE